MHRWKAATWGLLASIIVVGCTAPAAGPATEAKAQPGAPKRITAANLGTLITVSRQYNPEGSVPGQSAVEELLNAGLAHVDDRGELQPQLADPVPTVENGLWKLFPDGRMEITWKLRHGA